jgi:hypothetical protein
MKAITLTQPWASLVSIGAKRIETRSWQTRYRGVLAIHAGKGLGPVGGWAGLEDMYTREPVRSHITPLICGGGTWDVRRLPFGAIIAVADLVECERITPLRIQQNGWLFADGQRWELTEQERAFGDYEPGRFAWLLSNIRMLSTPLPARGAQGLWTVPDELVQRMAA